MDYLIFTDNVILYFQSIVVEVPIINGEPPAMLHSSRNVGEFSLLESGVSILILFQI